MFGKVLTVHINHLPSCRRTGLLTKKVRSESHGGASKLKSLCYLMAICIFACRCCTSTRDYTQGLFSNTLWDTLIIWLFFLKKNKEIKQKQLSFSLKEEGRNECPALSLFVSVWLMSTSPRCIYSLTGVCVLD